MSIVDRVVIRACIWDCFPSKDCTHNFFFKDFKLDRSVKCSVHSDLIYGDFCALRIGLSVIEL